MVLDKTGTLTSGKPVVNELIVSDEFGLSEEKLLFLVAFVETGFEHPLGEARVM